MSRRIGPAVGVAAGAMLAVLVPAAALAHPLGNFTINHYAGIRAEPDRVIVDIVIDQAEIPAFQEKLRIDTDGDGVITAAEADVERAAACPRLAQSIHLTVGGRSLALSAVEAGLSFPPGAAGLQTMRLVCIYVGQLPAPLAAATPIGFRDDSYPDRIGWREIVARGSGVTLAAAGLPSASVSDRLRTYPKDLISQPLDIRSATLVASPGGPTIPPFAVPDATPLAGAAPLYAGGPRAVAGPASGTTQQATAMAAVPGGVGADISGLLETRDLTPFVLLGSIVAAMALGAGHALTPGHGKTLMGAYLVGSRGTARHAIALGLSVTASHTLGILGLAAIVIAFRNVISPETFNRVAPIASGLLVLGIGGWLLLTQARSRHPAASHGRDAVAHENGHDHEHQDAAAHPDLNGHGHRREHDHDHGVHSHGGVRHSHGPAGVALSWRSLFVLGLAGGIIPSTNALIILLSTIATGRAAYGFVLVVAFGLGMAFVLGGVGLALVFARDRVDRLPSATTIGRFAPHAPLIAGVLVFSLGIYLTTTAVGVAPTF